MGNNPTEKQENILSISSSRAALRLALCRRPALTVRHSAGEEGKEDRRSEGDKEGEE